MEITIPDEIAQKMKRHLLMDWQAAVARDIALRLSERDLVEEILKESKLTEKDVGEIDRKIKSGLRRKYHGA